MGHTVTTAVNGEEAVRLWEEARDAPFDLIFMDVQMPVMGGLEATREIRRREQGTHRHIPIIAMTANAMKGDREHAFDVGMDDYLSKPFTSADLKDLLASWSRRIQAGVATGAVPVVPDPASAAEREVAREEAISMSALLRQADGDHDLARDMLKLFQEHLPRMVDDLAAAERSADLDRLRRVAHTVKGSASSLRAEQVRRTAEELETACRQRQAAQVADLTGTLRSELDRLGGAIAELLGEVSGDPSRGDVRAASDDASEDASQVDDVG